MQFLFQRGNIRPDEAPYAFVSTLEYHTEHARVYPFQIGEDAAVSYRHSESILFRKMARAVASVDLPFKIQFKAATSGSVIVDFSYLRTRCCTINLIRAKIVVAREFVYIGDACQTKSESRVKLWIPGIGARTFEYVDEYFFPISLLSCWTHESGEQIDRTDSLSETFDWSERGKFNYPTGIVQRNLVYLSKLRVTRASGKQKERSPSLYLRLLLLTFRIQLRDV